MTNKYFRYACELIILFSFFVGTYPHGQAASSNPVFQKGVSYIGWKWDELTSAESNGAIQQMADDSVKWVALCDFWFQDGANAVTIYSDSTRHSTSTPSLKYAIRQLHAHGLKVMLKPMVDLTTGWWRASIQPSNEWFSSYSSYIQFWSEFSKENNVDMLCLGCEYKRTQSWDSSWRMIAATARSHFKGPLTYAANWDDYTTVTWWDTVDYIGIDAYFPLSTTENLTLSDLSASWSAKADTIESWLYSYYSTKPVIFTEIGYQNRKNSYIRPASYRSRNAVVDNTIQQNCYQASFDVLTKRPWFSGFYWWQWDTSSTSGGPDTVSFTPQNKPAETTLRAWYSKTLPLTQNTLKTKNSK